jgi:hypothetical protein
MTTSVAHELPMATAKGVEGESNFRNCQVQTEWIDKHDKLTREVQQITLDLLNQENHYQ